MMKQVSRTICLVVTMVCFLAGGGPAGAGDAEDLIRESGFQGGLVVVIGSEDMDLLAGMGGMDSCIVQAVEADPRFRRQSSAL